MGLISGPVESRWRDLKIEKAKNAIKFGKNKQESTKSNKIKENPTANKKKYNKKAKNTKSMLEFSKIPLSLSCPNLERACRGGFSLGRSTAKSCSTEKSYSTSGAGAFF